MALRYHYGSIITVRRERGVYNCVCVGGGSGCWRTLLSFAKGPYGLKPEWLSTFAVACTSSGCAPPTESV